MTFAFVFGKLGDVIRILWLPYLLVTAAAGWLIYNVVPFAVAMLGMNFGEQPDPQQIFAVMQPIFAPCAVFLLVALIFVPMQYAGLLRFLLKGERPGGIFYLRFGKDEWNVLLTYIVFLLISLGIGIFFGAIETAAKFGIPGEAGTFVLPLIELVTRLVSLWVDIKLSLAFAAAIGISAIGIGRSWSLVKGNWWNLFGFYILLGIIYIILLCAMLAPFAHHIMGLFQDLAGAGEDPDAIKEVARQHLMDLQFWLQHPGPIGYVITAFHLAISFLLTAVGISAAGVAYRLIAGAEQDEAASTN